MIDTFSEYCTVVSSYLLSQECHICMRSGVCPVETLHQGSPKKVITGLLRIHKNKCLRKRSICASFQNKIAMTLSSDEFRSQGTV
jgi:hypothetical protein